jgi:hypothetical protein
MFCMPFYVIISLSIYLETDYAVKTNNLKIIFLEESPILCCNFVTISNLSLTVTIGCHTQFLVSTTWPPGYLSGKLSVLDLVFFSMTISVTVPFFLCTIHKCPHIYLLLRLQILTVSSTTWYLTPTVFSQSPSTMPDTFQGLPFRINHFYPMLTLPGTQLSFPAAPANHWVGFPTLCPL